MNPFVHGGWHALGGGYVFVVYLMNRRVADTIRRVVCMSEITAILLVIIYWLIGKN